MDMELAQAWVAALRSREYGQTSSWLRQGSCYCAMGVLCEVAIKQGRINASWSASGSPFANAPRTYQLYVSTVDGLPVDDGGLYARKAPEALAELVGTNGYGQLDGKTHMLTSYDPNFNADIPIYFKSLSEANDEGADFQQIADLIERIIMKLEPSPITREEGDDIDSIPW